MAPSQRPPIGDAAKLWEIAKVQLAQQDFEQPQRLASETLAHCKAEGVRYGEAAASLVLGLVELGKSQGTELLTLFSELNIAWGEVAQLLHVAQARVSSEGAAEAAKKATAAAGAAGADKWAKVAALSVAAYVKLEKDGPAGARDVMSGALTTCAQVGLAWGEAGALDPATSIHRTASKTQTQLKERLNAPSKLSPGKEMGLAQLEAAGAWLQMQEPEVALQAARSGLAQFRELGDKELEATALCMTARAQTAEGSVLEALQAANQAAALFKELGHRRGEASSLLVVAQAQTARYSMEDAVWKAKEALKIFRQLGCRMEEGDALEVIAKCSLLESDFTKGLEVAQQALDLSADLQDSPKEVLRRCLVSQMHTGRGNMEMGMDAARDALAKLQTLGDDAVQLGAYDALVAAYKGLNQLEDALATLHRAEEGFRQRGNEKDDALMLSRIAELHLLNSEPDQGLAAAHEVGVICKRLGDQAGIAKSLQMRAELCASQGDNAQAARRAEEAIDIYKELGKKGMPGHMACLEIVFNSYIVDGAFDNAIAEAKQALKYFNAQRERKFEASVMMAIADIETKRGNMIVALMTLQQAPALFLAVGDKRGEASAWLKIAQMHADKNEPDLAFHAAEEANKAYRKLGDRAGKISACQLIAEANFTLVPSGLGSARDAFNAAQEVVNMCQDAGDKKGEAEAMNTLVNAQLMTRSFVDATKTAYQAEELFQELGDLHGQASAMLLTSGAYLGEGKFAEAKTAVKEAASLFVQVGDTMGEDAAEDFIEQIDQYQKGQLNRMDFMGFSVSSPDDESQHQKKRGKKMRTSQLNLDVHNIEAFTFGPRGNKEVSVFFEKCEFRASRGAGKAKPRAETARGALMDHGKAFAPPKREQVLYTVRWVKSPNQPTGSRESSPLRDLSDKCSAQSMMLKAPSAGVGRVAPSERMFHAYGGEMGV